MIRLLCCSDTHGVPPPALDETEATGWLHAGDIHNRGHYKKKENLPQIKEWMDRNTLPVFSVRGNHDCSLSSEFFSKHADISGQCIEIAPGLIVLGIGWAGEAFYDLPSEIDIKRVCTKAKNDFLLKGKPGDKTIILSHYPPWSRTLFNFDGNPEGWMFESLRELIDDINPLAVITGHVHELFGQQLIYNGPAGKSIVAMVGPGGGYLAIDLESNAVEFSFLK